MRASDIARVLGPPSGRQLGGFLLEVFVTASRSMLRLIAASRQPPAASRHERPRPVAGSKRIVKLSRVGQALTFRVAL